ncbi:MAG: hypothetical protein ACD_46C00619G0001 [uncultured bacterium]|nr:MAG: hypothetical protein ACD_46C00619G0001 [uncultured bacterium]
MGDWQKLNDGIVRSLQQGHHIRSMGYHIASMKLSDVHSNWTSQLKEIASRAKLLNPFTKKLSYEEKIKKNNLFVGHQDKTFIFDLQKKPLNEIEISSDLNGLKKRGFILQHADQIIEWNKPRQNIEVTKYDDATNEWMQKIKESQLNEENSEKTSYYLIQNVKNLIEQTPWKVTMGGVSVQGINVKLPTNVARMYKLCLKADITGNEIGNMSLYNEITQLGKLAQKAHTFDFFGLRKRDQATQDFYDLFTQAPVEKKLEKEEKPIINPMKREQ